MKQGGIAMIYPDVNIPNYDKEAGIYYGCISQHTPMPEAVSDIFCGPDARDLSFECAVDEVLSEMKQGVEAFKYVSGDDVDWDLVKDRIEEDLDPCDEPTMLYECDGYKISTSAALVCLFVEKSPYFTHAKQCSPCAPEAGDLDNPSEDGRKCYCLGHDWFEEEKAPYPVFSVETGETIKGGETV